MALVSLIEVVAREETDRLSLLNSILASILDRIFDVKCINALRDAVELIVRRKLEIEANSLWPKRNEFLLSLPWNLFE